MPIIPRGLDRRTYAIALPGCGVECPIADGFPGLAMIGWSAISNAQSSCRNGR